MTKEIRLVRSICGLDARVSLGRQGLVSRTKRLNPWDPGSQWDSGRTRAWSLAVLPGGHFGRRRDEHRSNRSESGRRREPRPGERSPSNSRRT